MQFLPCRQCRLLRAQLLRCERESQERAAKDEQACQEIYEQMERLARLNMALVQQQRQGPSQAQQLQLMEVDECVKPRADTTQPNELDERVQRLQATVVQQAKVIDGLRRQLKSMVPTLQLDGATRTTGYDSDEESSDSGDRDNCDPASSAVDRGLRKLPLTSLHAQLKSRDAEIRRLEQHTMQLTQELDATRDKKRRAAQHYQQITNSQQTELRKHTASLQAQLRAQRGLERRIQELNEYVDVLERKLLVVARPARG